jgi:pseudouridine-5'-phosphate glycosidase
VAPVPEVLLDPEVADALRGGGAVVALESTLVSHGLPRPDNLRIAREIERTVREHGAVPATIAVVGGDLRIGLDDSALEAIAAGDAVAKVSARDLSVVMARKGHGATTIAATAHVAASQAIDVFATGGLGGVHREAQTSWDESADLVALATTPITVVCSGVKSVLDIGATLERLETLGITVVGYRTDRFPGFYLADSGWPVPWRLDSPAQVAALMAVRAAVTRDRSALVVANPLPAADQLDPALHDRVLRESLAAARDRGVTGKDVTPFLLDRFHHETAGASLAANVRLILRNAALAAEIACAHAAR